MINAPSWARTKIIRFVKAGRKSRMLCLHLQQLLVDQDTGYQGSGRQRPGRPYKRSNRNMEYGVWDCRYGSNKKQNGNGGIEVYLGELLVSEDAEAERRKPQL